jgi:hypothetical protein
MIYDANEVSRSQAEGTTREKVLKIRQKWMSKKLERSS